MSFGFFKTIAVVVVVFFFWKPVKLFGDQIDVLQSILLSIVRTTIR